MYTYIHTYRNSDNTSDERRQHQQAAHCRPDFISQIPGSKLAPGKRCVANKICLKAVKPGNILAHLTTIVLCADLHIVKLRDGGTRKS